MHSYLLCTQCEQNGTRRCAREMCYPIAQCVDGEGFARRVAGKRGKVMGCKPSCGGKGQAFTPEQRPQRARGQWQQSPSREAVSLATRGAEWARRPDIRRVKQGGTAEFNRPWAMHMPEGGFLLPNRAAFSQCQTATVVPAGGKRERRKGRHELSLIHI